MIPITKLVERLRDCCVVSNDTLYGDAASMLETLWAEVEAVRQAEQHGQVVDERFFWSVNIKTGDRAAVVEARRATDAELGRGGE